MGVNITADEMVVIESLIHEHEAIRGHIKTITAQMDGWTTGEEVNDPSPEMVQAASEKQLNLKYIMGYLEDGLKRHHIHEEGVMPSLVGGLIMEAIVIEHKEMLKQLGEINYILVNVSPRGILTSIDYIKMIIGNLCYLMTDHSTMEDIMLRLLKRKFI